MIRLWGVAEGQVMRTLRGHEGAVTALAFSRDGRTIASGSEDDTVNLWSPTTEYPLRKLMGHAASVTAVAFGGDLLAAGAWDGTIRLWNPTTGDLKHVVEEKGKDRSYCVTSLAFSEDGRRLASGSVYADGAQRLFIISVGLGEYPPPLALPSAHKNAQKIANLLERGGQRISKAVSKYLVLDEQNTQAALAAAFSEVSARATRDDVFVFYYAGRRAVVRRQSGEQDYYLMPTTVSDIKSEAALAAGGIPIRLFKQWLDSVPAQKQLLLLDSDDLNDIDGRSFLDRVRGGAKGPAEGRPDLAAVSASLDKRNIYMMSLSIDGEGEAAKVEGCVGTPFTCLTLHGLAGAADADGNRKVTTKELSDYLNGKLDELSSPQHRAVNKKWGAPFAVVSRPEHWNLPERWRGKVPISPKSAANAGPLKRGKSYALLIATSDYDHNDEADGEDDNDGWDRLPNAVSDAKRIQLYLQSFYSFEKVEVLENPGYETMVGKIHEYEEMAHGPEDQLLVYFAGHGLDNKYDEGYVIARDARMNDLKYANYLSYTELRLWLNKNSWRHVLVILDVCYGGNFNPNKSKDRGGDNDHDDFDPDAVETATPREIVDEIMPYNARRFIASGAKSVKDGYEGGRSPFTNGLISALQWGRDRGIVTADQIVGWLKTKPVTPKPVAGPFGDRDDPQGDFIFFVK